MAIALIIRNHGDNKSRLVNTIRNCVNISINSILSKVGDNTPVFIKELFDDIHEPEFPKKLMLMMKELDQLNVNYSIYELVGEQKYVNEGIYYEITIDRLKNMMSARERTINQPWN
ncbi:MULTISPECIES: hypothetical protein [Xenorhabdus]|uniref:hypothetical protein n=1 Tax=Xenorhabdus TaxID=626 RepID=UPI000542DE74|nr:MULTISPECIES: hypothetical protein [Xenorhabdus]MDE9434185.1 hypothetical protein [Xenorhabdus bovienii]MDE9491811.1 hypothetical protein [Xenorhabdus bovienii]MDE9508192.1 hypothetical protein [Xenorhabdus bovienii]CEE95297.1 hypothetical protein XNA1_5080005 [Xenorhabdus nematophila str. Anatoliense]